jgi:hypothetical protein
MSTPATRDEALTEAAGAYAAWSAPAARLARTSGPGTAARAIQGDGHRTDLAEIEAWVTAHLAPGQRKPAA